MSAGSKLKAGQVARFRVTPKDCQSVLDLLDEVGINRNGMSFNQCVSLAFGSLMETARKSGMLREPDPFQFANQMAPFTGHHQHRRKLEISDAIGGIGERFTAPTLPVEPAARPSQATKLPSTEPSRPAESTPPTAEQREAATRLTELLRKKDLAEEDSGVIWQQSDEEEYQRVYKVVYPYG